MRMTIKILAALCVPVSVAAVSHAQTIEWLHNSNTDVSTQIRALSHDGSAAVGGVAQIGGTGGQFYWRRSEGRTIYSQLETGEQISVFTCISPDGLSFGGRYVAGDWGGSGAMVRLANGDWERLLYWRGHHDRSTVRAITNNAQNMIVEYEWNSSHTNPSVLIYCTNLVPGPWLPDGLNGYNYFGGLSADGSVAAFTQDSFNGRLPSVRRSHVWSPGVGATMLPRTTDDPLEETYVSNISSDGRVVVGYSRRRLGPGDYLVTPLKWTDGVLTQILHPEGLPSVPGIVNYNGTLMANSQFVWENDSFPIPIRDFFDMHGVSLPSGGIGLTAMSADGTTFAFSQSLGGFGVTAAFIVTIPAPGVAGAVLAGMILASRRRR